MNDGPTTIWIGCELTLRPYVGLKPDVIVTTGGRVIPILKQMTQSVPIVMNTADPVGAGIVDSLARPGGNITGFSLYEFSIIGKSIEMLKENSAKCRPRCIDL